MGLLKDLVGFLLSRSLRRPHSREQEKVAASASVAEEQEAVATQRLAHQLRVTGRPADAVARLRHAYETLPEGAPVLRHLVGALIESDLCDKALAVARQSLARDASSYEANLATGLAYQKLHDPERALIYFEAARRARDDDAELYAHRGSALQELGRLDEAFADYERALALRPDFPLATFHRGIASLLVGDYERGWQGYDLRPRISGRSGGMPEWDGRSMPGGALLVLREQGLGDEIMFASLLPELAGMAGQLVVECDGRLRTLFERSFPRVKFFATIPGGGVPYGVARLGIDAAISAGSVPRFLRRSARDFPRHDGYLVADSERVGGWRERLARLGSQPKIGLSWVGGVRQTRRAVRSLALEQLLPILRTPGVRFVSLQYTPGAGDEVERIKTATGAPIDHWPEAIEDYEETAAVVRNLDLVISVCTSLVHLSGALGVRTWVMAPYSPEWRYGFRGESMPWYPSVRIFRQPAYRQWEPVIAAVARELRATAYER